jgi:hypothetical protein
MATDGLDSKLGKSLEELIAERKKQAEKVSCS